MTKPLILIGVLSAFAAPTFAAEDPIAVRQALMRSNSGAAAVAGAMMKNEMEYSPVVGRAVIAAWAGNSQAVVDFFPEGSTDEQRSYASPKIWEDSAGFLKVLGEYQTAAAAAAEASGKDGPPDLQAFTAAAQPVLQTCGTCHDTYRIEQ